MAYTLSNTCAKNLCKRTVLVQLIIRNVVTCFFGTQCRMDEASLFKFGKWDKDGRLHSLTEVKNFPWKERVLGHVMLLQILNPRSVFLEWMKLCTLFKFSKWIDCSKSHHRGEKCPLKGAWSGHVTLLKILSPLQYVWSEWSYTL